MADLKEIAKIISEKIAAKAPVKAYYTVSTVETRTLTFENGNFSLFKTLFDNNIDVVVIKDQKKGKASINKFDTMSINATIDSAFSSAESSNEDEFLDIAPAQETKSFVQGDLEPDIDKLMSRALELSDEIAKNYPKIQIIQLIYKYIREDNLYCNTNGTQYDVKRGFYEISLEYSGSDSENTSSLSGCTVYTCSLDKPLIELGNIKYELKAAEDSLAPAPLSEKITGDVIFSPSILEILFYFAKLSLLDDVALLDGTSLWKDKLGKKVAADHFSLYSNTSDDRIVDKNFYTNDGFPVEDAAIIKDGKLMSFAASLYPANKLGIERAKFGNYSLVVEPGNIEFDDMVKGIKKGLIVGTLACGLPTPSGEISGVAKNSFYVENGQIKMPVSETMVSFNIADMFLNITEISKEYSLSGNSVMPFIKSTGITIS